MGAGLGEAPERAAGSDSATVPSPVADATSERSKDGGRGKKLAAQAQEAAGHGPPVAAVPVVKPGAPAKGKQEIDWGALVPRTVGVEVGPLAGVVPAAQASGEITRSSDDSAAERPLSSEAKVVLEDASVGGGAVVAEVAPAAETVRVVRRSSNPRGMKPISREPAAQAADAGGGQRRGGGRRVQGGSGDRGDRGGSAGRADRGSGGRADRAAQAAPAAAQAAPAATQAAPTEAAKAPTDRLRAVTADAAPVENASTAVTAKAQPPGGRRARPTAEAITVEPRPTAEATATEPRPTQATATEPRPTAEATATEPRPTTEATAAAEPQSAATQQRPLRQRPPRQRQPRQRPPRQRPPRQRPPPLQRPPSRSPPPPAAPPPAEPPAPDTVIEVSAGSGAPSSERPRSRPTGSSGRPSSPPRPRPPPAHRPARSPRTIARGRHRRCIGEDRASAPPSGCPRPSPPILVADLTTDLRGGAAAVSRRRRGATPPRRPTAHHGHAGHRADRRRGERRRGRGGQGVQRSRGGLLPAPATRRWPSRRRSTPSRSTTSTRPTSRSASGIAWLGQAEALERARSASSQLAAARGARSAAQGARQDQADAAARAAEAQAQLPDVRPEERRVRGTARRAPSRSRRTPRNSSRMMYGGRLSFDLERLHLEALLVEQPDALHALRAALEIALAPIPTSRPSARTRADRRRRPCACSIRCLRASPSRPRASASFSAARRAPLGRLASVAARSRAPPGTCRASWAWRVQRSVTAS